MKYPKTFILILILVFVTFLDIGLTALNYYTKPVFNEINPIYIATKSWGLTIAVILLIHIILVSAFIFRYHTCTQFLKYLYIYVVVSVIFLHMYGAWTNLDAYNTIPNTAQIPEEELEQVVRYYQAPDERLEQASKELSQINGIHILFYLLVFKVYQVVDHERTQSER